MPERDKQVDAMARTLAGAPSRSFRTRLGDQPEEVTAAEWDAAQTTADRVYVDTIEATDFQRVLIEANKRHLTVHPDKSTMLAAADIGVMHSESLCGECITEVLLATDTNPPWTVEAESPRYLRYDPAASHGPLIAPERRLSGGAADFRAVDPDDGELGDDDLPGYWVGVSEINDPDEDTDWVPPTRDGRADAAADADTAAWFTERDDT